MNSPRPTKYSVSFAPAAAFDRDKLDPECRRLLNLGVEKLHFKPRSAVAEHLGGESWRMTAEKMISIDYVISDHHWAIVVIKVENLRTPRPYAKEFLV